MSVNADSAEPARRAAAAWASLEHDAAFQALKHHVKNVMSTYDASHDFDHVLRVLNMSHQLLIEESTRIDADPPTVYYAALLHDLFDRKYVHTAATESVESVLMLHGKDEPWATRVEEITRNVSYSYEIHNPGAVGRALTTYPELAIVQDADRLDAIGAIGIGRVFTYGGAKAPQRGMQGSVDHFVQKLERLKAIMKTQSGRRIAKERTERLKTFRSWWEEEMAVSSKAMSPMP